jgi:nicotinate-nucleotide adenylyltransferase
VDARTSVAAQRFRHARLRGRQAMLLGRTEAPAWCLVNVPMVDQSSSAIRARGEW